MNRFALKFLNSNGISAYQSFDWPKPSGKRPGKWVHAKGELRVCGNGIHAAPPEHALEWLDAECYLIELGGEILEGSDKLCARKGRLIRNLGWDSRLFAADCAERVLPTYEKAYPNDDRPRKAIEAARGDAIAAGAAAGAAAWAAAGAAAEAAARDAAGDAAGSAAGAAAWVAAEAAEREWQTQHLLKCLDLTAEELNELHRRLEDGGVS